MAELLAAWIVILHRFVYLQIKTEILKLDSDTYDKIKEKNSVDYNLYAHYLQKHNDMLLDYGAENVAADLKKLEEATQRMMKRCNLESNEKVNKSRFIVVSNFKF